MQIINSQVVDRFSLIKITNWKKKRILIALNPNIDPLRDMIGVSDHT